MEGMVVCQQLVVGRAVCNVKGQHRGQEEAVREVWETVVSVPALHVVYVASVLPSSPAYPPPCSCVACLSRASAARRSCVIDDQLSIFARDIYASLGKGGMKEKRKKDIPQCCLS